MKKLKNPRVNGSSMIPENHVEVTHLRDRLDVARTHYHNIMQSDKEKERLLKQVRSIRKQQKEDFFRLGRVLR